MAYVIHYENMNRHNKTVKLSEQTLKTLQENKKNRNKLGEENTHIQQCNNILDTFIDVYHRECYQKCTYTKTLLKRKSVRLTPESKGNVTKKQLFPSCSYFCKKIT